MILIGYIIKIIPDRGKLKEKQKDKSEHPFIWRKLEVEHAGGFGAVSGYCGETVADWWLEVGGLFPVLPGLQDRTSLLRCCSMLAPETVC